MTSKRQVEKDARRAEKRRLKRLAERGKRARSPTDDPGWRKTVLHLAVMTEFFLEEYPAANFLTLIMSPFPLTVSSIERDGAVLIKISGQSRAASVATAAETIVKRSNRIWDRCAWYQQVTMLDEALHVCKIVRAVRDGDWLTVEKAIRNLVAAGWVDLLKFFAERAKTIGTSNFPPETSPLTRKVVKLLEILRDINREHNDLADAINQDGGPRGHR